MQNIGGNQHLLSTDQLSVGVYQCAKPPYLKSDVRDLKKQKANTVGHLKMWPIKKC